MAISPGALARLVRLPNLLILAAAQVLARVCLVGPRAEWRAQLQEPRLWALVAGTALIAAAGYAINDYYDVKIDAINRPERLVLDRRIKRRYALILHPILNGLAFGLGLWLGWPVLALFVISAGMLWWYSNQLKRQPFVGNFVIALLTAASVLTPAMVYRQAYVASLFFAFCAFMVSLVREIVKDLEDQPGDAAHGAQTLPLVLGLRATKQVIYFIVATFAAVLVLFSGLTEQTLLGYIGLAMLPGLAVLVVLVRRADSQWQFTLLSRLCKLLLVIGLAGMVFYQGGKV